MLSSRDFDRVERASLPPSSAYLRAAALRSGRNPVSIALEALRFARAPGHLQFAEYVQFGLDDPKLDDDARRRFVSERMLRPIQMACNDQHWRAAAWDRWLSEKVFTSTGIPVAPITAVIGGGTRTYPGTQVLRTARELRETLPAEATREGGLFGKQMLSRRGFGSFLIAQADSDGVELEGEGRFTYEQLLTEITGSSDYVLQPVVRNAPWIERYTSHLATIRLCLLLVRDTPRIPFAVLKIPGPGSVTDHFWRKGNLACELDPHTGTIRRARTVDAFGTQEHDTHPVTGNPLVGETIPGWDDVIALAHRVGETLAPLRYQGLDVALTPQGPLLIESNAQGSISFLQLATSRGFLTDEVQDFLDTCGLDAKRLRRLKPYRGK